MGTYSSVACSEELGSMREVVDIFQGFSAGVTLRCAYADRYSLIADLLETPKAWPKATLGLTPYAVRAAVRVDGGVASSSGQEMTYQDALVDVEYNTTIVDVAAESIEPSMEAIPQSYWLFTWSDGRPLLEGEAPPLILRSMNLVRTRFRLSAIPTDVLAAVGSVNQYAYTSAILGLTFPAGTLMFLPAPLQRSWTNFTATGFTLTLKFGYKPEGWNKWWDTKNQSFGSIYLQGSGSPSAAYPDYDFSALFS